ncbi:MAG: sugar ABC transporter permease [Saprospirales bacterium]|nr:sugar ABC transporter permease [Saprospirales bacterium]
MKKPLRLLSWAVFLVLAALPLLAGWGYAGAYSLGMTGLLHKGVTLAHWQAVWSDAAFWKSMGFSVYVALTAISLATFFALLSVVAWQRDFRRGWLSYAVYLPLTVPAMVVGFFTFNLLSKGGLLSRISYRLGFTDSLVAFPDWVNDPFGIGIIVAHTWMAVPFFMLLFYNLFQSEGLVSLGQVARSLGAGSGQVVRKVFVPVLLRKASPILVLYGLFVMGSYEIPLLLGTQSPQMISVLAIRKLQRFNLMDVPQAYAVSVFFVVLVVGVLVLVSGRGKRWRLKSKDGVLNQKMAS